MKSSSYLLIALMSVLTLSCTDDLTSMGSRIQPEGDKIIVDTASIGLTSENVTIPYIYSKPDSLVLGTFVDNTYGTLYADILTQVQPPLDFSYPESAKADSAKVIMYYYSWFGDSYSPMEVNIYEMNKGKTFQYTTSYKSNIDVNEYTDKSVKIGSRIFSAKDAVEVRDDGTTIEFPLSDSFVKDFSAVMKKRYNDDPTDLINYSDRFHEFFNGIYITTDFGSASTLYLRRIVLRYYFHYKYLAAGDTDSTTVNTYVNYPANREVRQVNRFQHPNAAAIKQAFDATPEINVISSPANIYTKVNLPFGNLKSKMNVGNKKKLINRAVLRIDATEIDEATLAKPLVRSLLLIKSKATYDRFFKNRELPSDTCAILSNISYEVDDNDNVLYYYSFDVAKLITNELKDESGNNNDIEFYLVPVALQYDGNKKVIQVKQNNLPSAVKICSGTHPTSPMKLNLVYSGF